MIYEVNIAQGGSFGSFLELSFFFLEISKGYFIKNGGKLDVDRGSIIVSFCERLRNEVRIER